MGVGPGPGSCRSPSRSGARAAAAPITAIEWLRRIPSGSTLLSLSRTIDCSATARLVATDCALVTRSRGVRVHRSLHVVIAEHDAQHVADGPVDHRDREGVVGQCRLEGAGS